MKSNGLLVSVLGLPGSAKLTACWQLCQELHADMLDFSYVIHLWRPCAPPAAAIESILDDLSKPSAGSMVLNGFPRTVEHAAALLQRRLRFQVIVLELSHKEVEDFLANRFSRFGNRHDASVNMAKQIADKIVAEFNNVVQLLLDSERCEVLRIRAALSIDCVMRHALEFLHGR